MSARKWRAIHPERAREAERRWRAAHPEYAALYAKLNAAKIRTRNREWHIANRERRREQQRLRYRANPQKYRNLAMDYQARRRNAPSGPIDHEAIVTRDRGICQICRESVPERERSFDHIVPLSQGGAHAQWNLRLTHFRCNAARGPGRTPGQIYLPL